MEAAYLLLEDLRRAVEAHVFTHKEARFRTTLSIGLATTEGCADGNSFYGKLGRGLTSAVEYGRNRIELQH
jgi:PleD family two-component response regulator